MSKTKQELEGANAPNLPFQYCSTAPLVGGKTFQYCSTAPLVGGDTFQYCSTAPLVGGDTFQHCSTAPLGSGDTFQHCSAFPQPCEPKKQPKTITNLTLNVNIAKYNRLVQTSKEGKKGKKEAKNTQTQGGSL